MRVRACVFSVRLRSSDLRGERSKVAHQLICFVCFVFAGVFSVLILTCMFKSCGIFQRYSGERLRFGSYEHQQK